MSASVVTKSLAALNSPIPRSAVCLACLAVLVVGLARQIVPQEYQAADFTHTYSAARALRVGDNVYAPALAWVQQYERGEPLTNQYFYAPTFALLVLPLTLLPYQLALSIWGLCLLGFLCGAVYALLRSVYTNPPIVLVLVLAAAASLMSAVRAEYFLGQANLFMVACICAAIWARQADKPGLAGALLAVALATKPMLSLILVCLLWKREFKFAFVAMGGFFVLLFAPFLWLGRQALNDLFTLWHFYSTQYLSFSENISARGMLERLFTVNPFVRPLVDMPMLAVVLWLLVAGFVFLLMLAVVEPQPFRRESRSLVETGMIMSGLLLISPLTEPPYLVLLIIPFTATWIFLRTTEWKRPPFRGLSLALFGLWLAELVPRNYTEPFFWHHAGTNSIVADLFVTLAPTHFYILAATFVLQLYVAARASDVAIAEAVRSFVRSGPSVLQQRLMELWSILKLLIQPFWKADAQRNSKTGRP